MKSMQNVRDVTNLINSGKVLMLAGDEKLLSSLPKGKWIGGTIPYFMTEEGGAMTHDLLQVTVLPDFIKDVSVKTYDATQIAQIPKDYPSNGVSMIVVPALTDIHVKFAEEITQQPGTFDRPLVGWITGIELADLGKVKPKVFDGVTGATFEDKAVVMHLNLPEGKYGKLNIINLFKQGAGDKIEFQNGGFQVKDCKINGVTKNFAEYLLEKSINTQLPLVADYAGAMINVSFQAIDEKNKTVALYAPVFPGIEYRIAAAVGDYQTQFVEEMKKEKGQPTFTCNCILNYLYAGLEGRKTGNAVGPITFGEIAYMLLNQTMVYLTFEDA